MATGIFPLFFLIICFLVCSSEGQTIITAELGQNTILPCKVPNKNKNIRAVEWNRPDQDSDYVLLYRDGRIDPDHQHPSYQNRVDLQDEEMKDGDASMILKNVTKTDTGKYECSVFVEGKENPISINLEVHVSGQKIITAELGQDVILECKVSSKTNIRAVEWSRPHQEGGYVVFYWNGRFHPDHQNPSYQNRVDLQDKELKDGDASLMLKNVMKNDTGTYMCHVFVEGNNEPISIITLVVRLPGNEDRNTGHDGNKTGIIVGPVVGVILLLVVLGSLGFLMYRLHMKKNPHRPVPPDEPPAIQMSTLS